MAILRASIGSHNLEEYGLAIDELEDGSGVVRPKPEPILDGSEAVTGRPTFKRLKIRVPVVIKNQDLWGQKKTEFFSKFIGQKKTLMFSDDSEFRYYLGWIWLEDYEPRRIIPGFVLVMDADPWKYLRTTDRLPRNDRYYLFLSPPTDTYTVESSTLLSDPITADTHIYGYGKNNQGAVLVFSGLQPGVYFCLADVTWDLISGFDGRVTITPDGKLGSYEVGEDGILKLSIKLEGATDDEAATAFWLRDIAFVGFDPAKTVTIDAGDSGARVDVIKTGLGTSSVPYAYYQNRLLTAPVWLGPGVHEICIMDFVDADVSAYVTVASGVF